jgi:hypothetical protein
LYRHVGLDRSTSAEQAVSLLRSGTNAFVQGAAATPLTLLDALSKRQDVEGLELFHLHTDGPAPWLAAECEGRLHANCFFVGTNARQAVAEGRADTPSDMRFTVALLDRWISSGGRLCPRGANPSLRFQRPPVTAP